MNEVTEDQKQRLQVMDKSYRPFLVVVLLFSLYMTYNILRPFAHTIIFAIILASMFYPLHTWLARLCRGRNSLAALISILVITFVIVLPLLVFSLALISQAVQSINLVNDWIRAGNLQKIMEDTRIVTYTAWLQEHAPFIDLQKLDIQGNILQFSKNFGQFLLSQGANFLGDMLGVVARFFIMMFIIYFLLRDGSQMVDKIKYLAPLREDQEDRIIERIRAVARSALLGSFLVALGQGVSGGIGLSMVGIPGFFWGAMMGFTSLIPLIGTALIWVPAVIYLALLAKWKSMVFLVLWCVLVVGSFDNFLRPYLMKGQAGMSPFYIFLAIIGGVQYFGLPGIVYGPLILTFAMVMLYIYQIEYRDLLVGLKGEEPTPGKIEEPGQRPG
jgi:predicted PurR-regulated permease PerM